MKCKEILDQLPGYALGDLDVEPKRAIERHLAECAACRAEADRASRALAELRSLPAVETAEGRRNRAVAAMASEHARQVEGILLRPRRRRWVRIAGIAAAVLVGLLAGGFFLLRRGPESYTLQTVEVRGRAQVFRKGGWEPLRPGMSVTRGDRILTERETVVLADLLLGDRRVGRIFVNESSSLTVGIRHDLDLDRGTVYVEVADAPLLIRTLGNDSVRTRSGRCEVGLRETFALVLGISYKRPPRPEGADLVFENEPFEKIAEEISRRSGKTVRPAHEKVAQYRVSFYGFSRRGSDLTADLESAVRDQGLTLREEEGGWVARLVVPAEKSEVAQRLFARIVEGEASLASAVGALQLRGGEEGVVSTVGTPTKEPLSSSEIPWTRPGHFSAASRRSMPLPGSLVFRVVGYDDRQRPLVECTLEGAELVTTLDGESIEVTVGNASAVGEEEIVVPLKVRIDRKR